jgi:leucine dehydrogenase
MCLNPAGRKNIPETGAYNFPQLFYRPQTRNWHEGDTMPVFQSDAFDDHEQVVFCHEPRTGLKAIIAIHSTALGPAAGGCRMWNYANEAEALHDVLRLSRGMSYKNAMADLCLGGGKAVILANPRQDRNARLLEAFGECVERLGGRYITAEDVGMSIAEMEIVARRTSHVCGLPKKGNTAGGDPSPKTAYGVYLGILAAVAFRTGEPEVENLRGIRVAVQGLGAVGYKLCSYLSGAGAELLVAEIDRDRVRRACAEFGATAADPEGILQQDADVLAPCALGGILNEQSIPQLKVSIIAGAANNQLATEADGAALHARDILYAPDYVINAGGIINVACEHLGLNGEAAVLSAIERIGPRLLGIFRQARETDRPTSEIADDMARARLTGAATAPPRQASCAA